MYSNFPNKQKGMNQILIQTPIDSFNSSTYFKKIGLSTGTVLATIAIQQALLFHIPI